jgi:hypothetical protein
MRIPKTVSRVSAELRRELVAEVKSVLPAGAEFNVLYGRLISHLEKAESPSLEQARLILANPHALLEEHAANTRSTAQAREAIKRLIVEANVPKAMNGREQVVEDTLAFLNRLNDLSPNQVKELTLMRQRNGNTDPELVGFEKIESAEALAENLDAHYSAANHFVLLRGQTLKANEYSRVPSFSM